MKGYTKIAETCRRAGEVSELQYAWVDTCCIDKTSSAELSEAINSMFRWYQVSQVCYVRLADIDKQTHAKTPGSLDRCRWFTRGWTLQELIAPTKVEFYDKRWAFLGDRSDLRADLERITGIGNEVLGATSQECITKVLGKIPVARRMSWAASRVTTRTEDTAYCLLGIFGVNLPLLYGEGPKAFLRLQEEVAKEHNDLSLFGWTSPASHGNLARHSGILADSPADFANARDIDFSDLSSINPEFAMTNKGLRMWSVLCEEGGKMILPLNCRKPNTLAARVLGIYLLQFGPDLYVREHPGRLAENLESNNTAARTQTIANIFVSKRMDATIEAALVRGRRGAIRLSDSLFDEHGWKASIFQPDGLYTKQTRLFLTLNLPSFVACFMMSLTETAKRGRYESLRWVTIVVVLGMEGEMPWARICTTEHAADAFSSLGNLKQMAQLAKVSGSKTVKLRNDQQKLELEVTVDFSPCDIEGEMGHCLSMSQNWVC